MGACLSEPIDFEGEVDLRHFELQRSVGKGAFGKVRIVRKKNDKHVYALKYINKMKCISMKAVNHIIQERRLLEEVRHPFIVNLRYAFQDDENLFMVLDLMLGGDLRFHLERTGPMKEDVVRHYVAEIGSALHYLHKKRIVHRDLKPDNILLDDKGHAHLTDFNIAVRYTEGTPLKSVAGSMVYMAPEVVGKKGYYSSPDFWSLGVTMYELLYGRRPFRGKTNEMLIQAILNDAIGPPSSSNATVSQECRDLLFGLIERDIGRRLGCGDENWELFLTHSFFVKQVGNTPALDWALLESKSIRPPFVPDPNRSNFDASHELEELLLEENPLRVKKRKENRDYSKFPGGADGEIAKQMQLMEKKYTVFDFKRVVPDDDKLINTPAPSMEVLDVKKSIEIPPPNPIRTPSGSKREIDPHEISMHDLANFKETGPQVPGAAPTVGPAQGDQVRRDGSSVRSS